MGSQNIEYAVSASGDVRPETGWAGTVPEVGQGGFLWSRTTVVYSDGTRTVTYGVSRMGADGASVSIKSRSVRYANTRKSPEQPADPSFRFDSIGAAAPALGDYLWSVSEVVFSDNTSLKSYAVFRIGADGADGQPGARGADGRTQYTHLAYAYDDRGTGFSTTSFKDASWLGMYQDETLKDSPDWKRYRWTRIRGDNGSGYTENMLTGTRDWKHWTQDAAWVRGGESRFNGLDVLHADGKGKTSGYTDISLNTSVELEPDTLYTLSVWLKGTGSVTTYVYPDANADIESMSEGTSYGSVRTSEDTAARHTLGPAWKRYYVVFRTRKDVRGLKNVIAARVPYGTEAYVCGAKLEKGGNTSPAWTPNASDLYGSRTVIGVRTGRQTSYTMSQLEEFVGRESGTWSVANPGDFKEGDLCILNLAISDRDGIPCQFYGEVRSINGSDVVLGNCGMIYGGKGRDGAGISEVQYKFVFSDNAYQPADTFFDNSPYHSVAEYLASGAEPDSLTGRYIWCRTRTVYTGGLPPTNAYFVSRVGYDGGDGAGIHLAYASGGTVNASGSISGYSKWQKEYFYGAEWLGVNLGVQKEDPSDVNAYKWSRFKGDKGADGRDGRDGKNGQDGRDGKDGQNGRDGVNYTENLLLRSNVPVQQSGKYLLSMYYLSEDWKMNTEYTVTVWGSVDFKNGRRFACFAGSDNYPSVILNEVSPGVYRGVLKTGDKLGPLSWKASNSSRMLLVYDWPNAKAYPDSFINRIKVEEGVNDRPMWTPNPSEMGTGDILNLVISGEKFTVPQNGKPAENNFSFRKFRFKPGVSLGKGQKIAVSFDNVVLLKGTASKFTVSVFDSTATNLQGSVVLGMDAPRGVIAISRDIGDPCLIVYAGEAGKTLGNLLECEGLSVVNGDRPRPYIPRLGAMSNPSWRITDWQQGVEYLAGDYDPDIDARIQDVATRTSGAGRHAWLCLKRHVSSPANMPPENGNNEYWMMMDATKPIYVSTLVADNAVFHFGQAQEITIAHKGENGEIVNDGRFGAPLPDGSGKKVIISAGGSYYSAPYKVYSDGSSVQTGVTIQSSRSISEGSSVSITASGKIMMYNGGVPTSLLTGERVDDIDRVIMDISDPVEKAVPGIPGTLVHNFRDVTEDSVYESGVFESKNPVRVELKYSGVRLGNFGAAYSAPHLRLQVDTYSDAACTKLIDSNWVEQWEMYATTPISAATGKGGYHRVRVRLGGVLSSVVLDSLHYFSENGLAYRYSNGIFVGGGKYDYAALGPSATVSGGMSFAIENPSAGLYLRDDLMIRFGKANDWTPVPVVLWKGVVGFDEHNVQAARISTETALVKDCIPQVKNNGSFGSVYIPETWRQYAGGHGRSIVAVINGGGWPAGTTFQEWQPYALDSLPSRHGFYGELNEWRVLVSGARDGKGRTYGYFQLTFLLI